ncbi:MAG: phage baseplate protein [Nitrospinota bacterium]|nr:phage baseplate protein [Nitrospinota bacterium]
MRSLNTFDVIGTWERGEGRYVTDTALSLLMPAFPEKSLSDLADLTVGQRDAALFELFEKTFGKKIPGFAKCPKCDEHLEFDMSTVDFRTTITPDLDRKFSSGNFEITFRPITGRDLLETQNLEEISDARMYLIEKAVVNATRDGIPVPACDLPQEVVQILSTKLSQSDPLSEIMLDLHCPLCGESWESLLDIVIFFFLEITAETKRLLNEVHILAEAYGWREDEILSLSPERRSFYMDIAGQ